MSRLKSIRWACVPAWLVEFCSDNELAVDYAAVAGSVISYSFFKKAPIDPSYQSLWGCITVKDEFVGTSVGHVKGIIRDLVALEVLFETDGGKVMPGRVAMIHEAGSASSAFWEPVVTSLAVDDLIKETSKENTP